MTKKFLAAAVQAAPVYLDKEGSVEKACNLILEAGKKGASLIALPEVFISGYPYWVWFKTIEEVNPYVIKLFNTSIKVPGPETEALGRAARQAAAYVVIGVNEVDNKALYNTLLFFDREGNLMGKHRKLKPTYSEQLVWAAGDGSTHKVYDTEIGMLGGLICGEHIMVLPGYTLSAMGEQVHVASWVGFSSCLGPALRQGFRSLTEVSALHHAMAYQNFVLNTQSIVDDYTLEVLGNPPELDKGGGWTAILAAGSGRIIAGPLVDEEGIVYAEIDLSESIPFYLKRDVTGQYWSPFFSVDFDSRPHVSMRSLSKFDKGGIVINNNQQVSKTNHIEEGEI